MNHNKNSQMRVRLLQRYGIFATVSALLALCLVVSGVLAGFPARAQGGVDIAVVPSSKTVLVNEIFTLDIYVYPNGQQVDAVDADMTFNPTYLEVQSITGDTSGLPDELYSAVDNTAGTLTHSRGKLTGTPPSSTFRLCSIELKAEAATEGTPLAFTALTNAYFQGGKLLREKTDGIVIIRMPVIPVGGVTYPDAPGQILALWVGLIVVGGLILGAVGMIFRRRKGV